MISRVPPQARFPNPQQRFNVPMACETCGSTFFIKSSAREYSNGGYGSAEFRELSGQARSVYVCLCGAPMPMKSLLPRAGHRPNSENDHFLTSLQKAVAYRKANQLQQVAKGCVSLAEHEELRHELAKLQKQMAASLDAGQVSERATAAT